MPGTNLSLPIPTLSDTQTQVVTKTAQALTLINTDLAAPVVSAEISIDEALPFNGFGATGLGYLKLNDALAPTLPGTAFYANGEWFLCDGAGTVQVTSNGQLNISAIGGIGGDYSSVNALISYDSANSRYRFFGAGGTSLVDLDARSLVVNNTSNGAVTFSVDASVTTPLTFRVKSLPTSLVGILAYDASTNTVVDGSTITAPIAFSNVTTFSGNVVFNGLVKHGNYTTEIPLFVGEETQTNVQTGANQLTGVVSANPSVWSSSPFSICGLRTNDVVQSVIVRMTKASAALATVSIFKRAVGGSTTAVPLNAGNTSTATGSVDITATVTTPTAIATRERWWVQISFTNASVTAATVTWTQ